MLLKLTHVVTDLQADLVSRSEEPGMQPTAATGLSSSVSLTSGSNVCLDLGRGAPSSIINLHYPM